MIESIIKSIKKFLMFFVKCADKINDKTGLLESDIIGRNIANEVHRTKTNKK